jgi:hypothetical protein
MTNANIKSELDNIASGFGKISMKLDACKLSEIAKTSIVIVDHARALKDDGLISPTDYLKIIDRANEYIDDADKKCVCNER